MNRVAPIKRGLLTKAAKGRPWRKRIAENNIGNKPDAQLESMGKTAENAITAGGGSYGTSTGQDTALASANTAFGTALTGLSAAKASYKAALQTRDSARADLVSALRSIGTTIYADPAVTDQMIADAGYAVHDTTPEKHSPVMVEGFSAVPVGEDSVLFTWDRGANTYPCEFVIEGRADGSSTWSQVYTTTKARIEVAGFAAGVPYWFRVTARRNNQVATPSFSVGIWGATTSPATLSLAA